jgi:hypothetical protein
LLAPRIATKCEIKHQKYRYRNHQQRKPALAKNTSSWDFSGRRWIDPSFDRCRRLAKDFENLNRNALAFLRLHSVWTCARLSMRSKPESANVCGFVMFDNLPGEHVRLFTKNLRVRQKKFA